MMTLNIIGAGRCGLTLAYLLKHANLVKIQGICNLTIESAQNALEFIGDGKVFAYIEDLPSVDIVLIACPDDQIEIVAKKLAQSPHLKVDTIVFHCSGALSSQLMLSLKEKGSWIASAHPMISFANPLESIASFIGSYCSIEGDVQAREKLIYLFEKLGAHTFTIHTDKKALYHVASVFSSNYLVSLAHLSYETFVEAGIDKELSRQLVLSLMNSNLKNLNSSKEFARALTGPIQRGDSQTIQKHMKAIFDTELKEIYAKLGLITLKLSKISQDKKEKIIKILK